MTTDALVRDQLDDVVDDLIVTIAGDHTGHELTPPMVQALVAFLSDLRDMHDEQAIDVELWPTLAGFCQEYLAVGCRRPYAHPGHDTVDGHCPGHDPDSALAPAQVKGHVENARAHLRGGTQ